MKSSNLLIDIIDTSDCPNILGHGGKRKNSGRKPSGINWKTVSFRIKEEWREPVKVVVRAEIKRLKSIS